MDVLKLILDNESCPFDEWLEGLRDVVGKARIIRQVDKIERGLFGDWKSVGEGVFELRLNFGPGYRVYYGREGETIVILLGGSDKSHQRVAIETAHRHWRTICDQTRHHELFYAGKKKQSPKKRSKKNEIALF